MEENKVELTDKEKEEEKRRNLINYFLEQPEKIELDDIYDTNKKEYQQGEKCAKPEKYSWWYDEEKEIFNQKAHVIMNILSNSSYAISNKGYRLWFLLASKDNKIIVQNLAYTFLKKKNTIDFNNDTDLKEIVFNSKKNLSTIINYPFNHPLNTKNIEKLFEYSILYFSKISNFENENYSSYNKPILENLYDWYLDDLKNKEEIEKYCKYFEEMISNMQQLLIKYFDNAVYKYNLICTICKTNEILNTLKLNILNKNKNDNDNENDSQKKFLETENELMKTILKAIKLTPTIKI